MFGLKASGYGPEGLILFGATLLIIGVFGKRPRPPRGGTLLVLLFLILGASASAAERPPMISGSTDVHEERGPFEWAGYAVTGRSWTEGRDPFAFVGARLEASAALPFGLQVLARVDATRTQDGAAADEVRISDPATFTALEISGALHVHVVGGLGPAIGYGIALPMDAGPAIVSDHPERLFVGVMYRVRGLWLAAGGGLDQAAGAGLKAQLGAQVQVKGNTHVGGDVSFPGAVARTVVLVRWGGSGR